MVAATQSHVSQLSDDVLYKQVCRVCDNFTPMVPEQRFLADKQPGNVICLACIQSDTEKPELIKPKDTSIQAVMIDHHVQMGITDTKDWRIRQETQ